ncbi:unnamed protein product [Amoebophrya sp. A25]|nr:unnamed protein product [Amoebophrya sp. A25]|eukprot:GSA25T00004660001.1
MGDSVIDLDLEGTNRPKNKQSSTSTNARKSRTTNKKSSKKEVGKDDVGAGTTRPTSPAPKKPTALAKKFGPGPKALPTARKVLPPAVTETRATSDGNGTTSDDDDDDETLVDILQGVSTQKKEENNRDITANIRKEKLRTAMAEALEDAQDQDEIKSKAKDAAGQGGGAPSFKPPARAKALPKRLTEDKDGGTSKAEQQHSSSDLNIRPSAHPAAPMPPKNRPVRPDNIKNTSIGMLPPASASAKPSSAADNYVNTKPKPSAAQQDQEDDNLFGSDSDSAQEDVEQQQVDRSGGPSPKGAIKPYASIKNVNNNNNLDRAKVDLQLFRRTVQQMAPPASVENQSSSLLFGDTPHEREFNEIFDRAQEAHKSALRRKKQMLEDWNKAQQQTPLLDLLQMEAMFEPSPDELPKRGQVETTEIQHAKLTYTKSKFFGLVKKEKATQNEHFALAAKGIPILRSAQNRPLCGDLPGFFMNECDLRNTRTARSEDGIGTTSGGSSPSRPASAIRSSSEDNLEQEVNKYNSFLPRVDDFSATRGLDRNATRRYAYELIGNCVKVVKVRQRGETHKRLMQFGESGFSFLRVKKDDAEDDENQTVPYSRVAEVYLLPEGEKNGAEGARIVAKRCIYISIYEQDGQQEDAGAAGGNVNATRTGLSLLNRSSASSSSGLERGSGGSASASASSSTNGGGAGPSTSPDVNQNLGVGVFLCFNSLRDCEVVVSALAWMVKDGGVKLPASGLTRETIKGESLKRERPRKLLAQGFARKLYADMTHYCGEVQVLSSSSTSSNAVASASGCSSASASGAEPSGTPPSSPDNTVNYIGTTTLSKRHGRGVMYSESCVSTGYWLNDAQSGPGTELHLDGTSFTGMYSRDLRNGYGMMCWEGGAEYQGCFVDGKAHGAGVLLRSDKSYYVGQFEQDRMHGQGEMIWADGTKYVGQYAHNKRHGVGIMAWANESNSNHGREGGLLSSQGGNKDEEDEDEPKWSRYYGEWVNGKQEGLGVLLLKDGTKCPGLFHDGQLTEWLDV